MKNIDTRVNNIEKELQKKQPQEFSMWICQCGEEPCVCSEDHKNHRCEKWPSGSCKNCKQSNRLRFMSGDKEVGGSNNELLG